jgi:hypothetical protein
MHAMHALAIRDFAGLPVSGSSYRAYDSNAKAVKSIRTEVESFVARDKALEP